MVYMYHCLKRVVECTHLTSVVNGFRDCTLSMVKIKSGYSVAHQYFGVLTIQCQCNIPVYYTDTE